MTRLKTLSLAGALSIALATSLSGLAMAQTAGSGGAGGGDGGISFNDVPVVMIQIPTYPQPVQNQATTARECAFELLRGHYCTPRRAR
ncbi:hypothetical protein [Phreatobacter sp.]|uniref:hypothetical protein n=1 Tax=Phreatobacter sp. TaxID=1966341 RepID=UPI003F716231